MSAGNFRLVFLFLAASLVGQSLPAAQASDCNVNQLVAKPTVEGVAIETFTKTPLLGDYGLLKFSQGPRRKARVIIDRKDFAFIDSLIKEKYQTTDKPSDLRNSQIEELVGYLGDQFQSRSRAPKKRISEGPGALNFKDFEFAPTTTKNDWLAIATQYILEKYTKQKTRLMLLDNKDLGWARRPELAVVVKGRNGFERFSPVSRFETPPKLADVSTVDAKAKYGYLPKISMTSGDPVWKKGDGNRPVIVFTKSGRAMKFAVVGGATAGRKMEKQEAAVQQALAGGEKAPETLPLEILYHPFYPPFGHSSIRIGSHLYEMGMHGWRGHFEGKGDAAGWMANNAYFKSQAEKYTGNGVTPLSMGTEFSAPTELVLALRKDLEEKVANPIEKFDFYRNNCNQVIIAALERAGIIKPGQFNPISSFSSVYHSTAWANDRLERVGGPITRNLYPIGGLELDASAVRNFIPESIVEAYTWKKELREKLMFWGRRITQPKLLLELFHSLTAEP